MKAHNLILTTAILSLPLLVCAEGTNNTTPDKTMDKWSCEEFIAIDEQFKPKTIYWASAHAKGSKKHNPKTLNIEGTEKVIPIVIEECTQQPKATFLGKLKNAWQKVEAGAKADVKEIKTNLEDIKTNLKNNPQ